MSLPEFEHMRSGALPGHDREEQEQWLIDAGYDNVTQAQAARIANAVLSEPVVGREGVESGFYLTDEQARKANARRGRGLQQGYGDEAARAGYDARTGGTS